MTYKHHRSPKQNGPACQKINGEPVCWTKGNMGVGIKQLQEREAHKGERGYTVWKKKGDRDVDCALEALSSWLAETKRKEENNKIGGQKKQSGNQSKRGNSHTL